MTPEQYTLREELKALAHGSVADPSWTRRTTVEAEANELVLSGADQCRQRILGCALCHGAGLTCEDINSILSRSIDDEGNTISTIAIGVISSRRRTERHYFAS